MVPSDGGRMKPILPTWLAGLLLAAVLLLSALDNGPTDTDTALLVAEEAEQAPIEAAKVARGE